MKIYVAHATALDYQQIIYQPLKNSDLYSSHDFIFPHETSVIAQDSRAAIAACDLVLAEVSLPSTGLGIELGWADVMNKTIILLHQETAKLSSALNIISSSVISYNHAAQMIEKLTQYLDQFTKSN